MLDAAATCVCSFTFSVAGSLTISVVYGGDPNFAGSSVLVPVTVPASQTAIAITNLPLPPSNVGSNITVTVSVTVMSGVRSQPVTGSVVISAWASTRVDCIAYFGSGGEPNTAQCSLSFVQEGQYLVSAFYGGSATLASSTSDSTLVSVTPNIAMIDRSTSTTIANVLTTSSIAGTALPVQFTVRATAATSAVEPSGYVTVSSGGGSSWPDEVCRGPIDPLSGVGVCMLPLLHASTKYIMARYDGDNNYDPSSSNQLVHVVRQALSTIMLTDGLAAVTAQLASPTALQPISISLSVQVEQPPTGASLLTALGTLMLQSGDPTTGTELCLVAIQDSQPVVCSFSFSQPGPYTALQVYFLPSDASQLSASSLVLPSANVLPFQPIILGLEASLFASGTAFLLGSTIVVSFQLTLPPNAYDATLNNGAVVVSAGGDSCTAALAPLGSCRLVLSMLGDFVLHYTYQPGLFSTASYMSPTILHVRQATTALRFTSTTPSSATVGADVTFAVALVPQVSVGFSLAGRVPSGTVEVVAMSNSLLVASCSDLVVPQTVASSWSSSSSSSGDGSGSIATAVSQCSIVFTHLQSNLTIVAEYSGDRYFGPSSVATSLTLTPASTALDLWVQSSGMVVGAQKVVVHYQLHHPTELVPTGSIIISSHGSSATCRDDASNPTGLCVLPFAFSGDYLIAGQFMSAASELLSSSSSIPLSIPCVAASDCAELSRCLNVSCSAAATCSVSPRCYDGLACTTDMCDEYTGECAFPYHSCSTALSSCSVWVCSDSMPGDLEDDGSCTEVTIDTTDAAAFFASISAAPPTPASDCAISQANSFLLLAWLEQRGQISATQAIGEISYRLSGLVSGAIAIPRDSSPTAIWSAATNALFAIYSRESSPSYLTLSVTARSLSLLARVQDQMLRSNVLTVLDMAVSVSYRCTEFDEPYTLSNQLLVDLLDTAGITITSTFSRVALGFICCSLTHSLVVVSAVSIEHQSNRKREAGGDPTLYRLIDRSLAIVTNIEQGSRAHLHTHMYISVEAKYIDLQLFRSTCTARVFVCLCCQVTHRTIVPFPLVVPTIDQQQQPQQQPTPPLSTQCSLLARFSSSPPIRYSNNSVSLGTSTILYRRGTNPHALAPSRYACPFLHSRTLTHSLSLSLSSRYSQP